VDFFEQLEHGGIPEFTYPELRRASGLKAALTRQYLKLFRSRLRTFKPVGLVNGMPVYDLTQPPLHSEPGQRILDAGAAYKLLGRPARPIAAVLGITHACDCDCRHCSARDYMRGGRRTLDYEELIDLFDQVLEAGAASIVLTGGEPTLHKRLLDLVAHVPKDKATVSMFTNGARLDRAFAEELRSAGLFAALVSLDSPDPATHDAYRRREGAFATGVRAIEALQAAGSLAGMSTYFTRGALHAGVFEETVDLARRLGVNQILGFDSVPVGAMRQESAANRLTPEDREELKRRTMEVNATSGLPGLMGQSWINSPEGFGCFAGFYQVYVSASGDVMPCDFTPISFGSVQGEPFALIWKRIRDSAEWHGQAQHCRMQDDCFRAHSVDLIPHDEPLPVSYERLQELRSERAGGASEPLVRIGAGPD